LPENS